MRPNLWLIELRPAFMNTVLYINFIQSSNKYENYVVTCNNGEPLIYYTSAVITSLQV